MRQQQQNNTIQSRNAFNLMFPGTHRGVTLQILPSVAVCINRCFNKHREFQKLIPSTRLFTPTCVVYTQTGPLLFVMFFVRKTPSDHST